MLMPGRSMASYGYRFGFNGKEKDDEIDGVTGSKLDFGARIYDSRLGRWLALDPLAAKYPFASPYNFALNTPIQAKDPDGRLVIFVNGYHRNPLLDLFGLNNKSLTGEGKKKYWSNKLDEKFMDKIGDHHSMYVDGGRAYNSRAYERYSEGYQTGKALIKKIESGEIELEKDENGKIIESIKLVSHSQGSANAAGIEKALTEKGYKVEVSYNIAPKQPGQISESGADRVVQYSSGMDMVAPQSKMEAADEVKAFPDEGNNGPIDGHLTKNQSWITKIAQGKYGGVAKRKDKAKDVVKQERSP
jgi:RHS repeat-associated protein